MRNIVIRLILLAAIVSLSYPASAQSAADKYLGYKWQPVRLSSYTSGTAPEIQANLHAFAVLVKAGKAPGGEKYLADIINGFWFYTTAYAWSTPEETGGKLPPYEGQQPTPNSLRTAGLLIDAWNAFSSKVNPQLPVLEPQLAETMKRICGKNLK